MFVPTLAGMVGIAKVTSFESACVMGVDTSSGNIHYSTSCFGVDWAVWSGGSYCPTYRDWLTSIDLGGP